MTVDIYTVGEMRPTGQLISQPGIVIVYYIKYYVSESCTRIHTILKQQ